MSKSTTRSALDVASIIMATIIVACAAVLLGIMIYATFYISDPLGAIIAWIFDLTTLAAVIWMARYVVWMVQGKA